MKEPLDVLDEVGHVVATLPREEVHAKGLLHRCVHVLVRTPQGELWVQRRALDRRLWPGKWTSSVSGHVDAGEGEGEAARREALEELGLALAPGELRRVAEFRYRDAEENEVAGLWEATTAALPKPGPEVMDVRAVDRAALEAWRRERPGDFAPSFREALQAYGWA
jgi:isopentenyldiphosphate isomerase